MNKKEAYVDFVRRLTLLIRKNSQLINVTLSNIFTMRLIGNKTHGDLAEIGISEFVNQYMYDFKSTHVGKDLYRSKQHEEDIKITNEIENICPGPDDARLLACRNAPAPSGCCPRAAFRHHWDQDRN